MEGMLKSGYPLPGGVVYRYAIDDDVEMSLHVDEGRANSMFMNHCPPAPVP